VVKGQRKCCGTSCCILIFKRDYWRKLEFIYIQEDLFYIAYKM